MTEPKVTHGALTDHTFPLPPGWKGSATFSEDGVFRYVLARHSTVARTARPMTTSMMRMPTVTEHRCAHGRVDHRHNGAGRCIRPGCPCLVGPGPLNRPAAPERTPAGGVVTIDGSGVVVDYQPAQRQSQSERTRLERMLWNRLVDADLTAGLVKQFYWARPERMFRSDFAYVAERILIEVQGGIWAANPGRHNRASGYEADLSRANLAALLGWKLLAFSERMIKDGEAAETIRRALTPVSKSEEQLCLTR